MNEDRSHQFGRYLGDHLPSWLLREPVFSVSTVVRFEDRRRSGEPFPLPNRESRHTPPSPVLENVEYTPLHLHSDVFMDPGHARHPVPRPSGSGHLGNLVLGQSGAVGMAALVECEVRQQRTPPPGLLATRVTVPGRSPDPGTEITPPQQTTLEGH